MVFLFPMTEMFFELQRLPRESFQSNGDQLGKNLGLHPMMKKTRYSAVGRFVYPSGTRD